MEKEERLGFYELFYIFLFGCLFGYVVEVIWSYYRFRVFINHTSLVIGPFNMVYGFTAAVLSLVLTRFKKSNVFKLFIISFITGTVLEYIISFCMEMVCGFVAWDYSRYILNINGRVCLKYSIFWGILGVVWIKLIESKVLELIKKIPRIQGGRLLKFLLVFMAFDWALTFIAVDRAKDFEQGIEPRNRFEEVLDNTFNKDYLNNMYNNRWDKRSK